jgi:hypothetical protein
MSKMAFNPLPDRHQILLASCPSMRQSKAVGDLRRNTTVRFLVASLDRKWHALSPRERAGLGFGAGSVCNSKKMKGNDFGKSKLIES